LHFPRHPFVLSFFIIASDTLSSALSPGYGVLTPLFASTKGAKVLVAKNVFIRSFSRACLGAIEATNRRAKPGVAAHGSATAVFARKEICLTV
jgi:hypothetical protein